MTDSPLHLARKEYGRYRQVLLRQNRIDKLICARCGVENKSNHLHHLKEIAYGGNNDRENLIPLCADCHKDWDTCESIGMRFGEFLVSVSTPIMQMAIKRRMLVTSSNIGETLKALYLAQFYAASLNSACDSYWDELERQNNVFSTYRYSNSNLMLESYGSMYNSQ